MSTKVRATILSAEGSTITLSLESPYFAVLPKDGDVFVELQTLQGNRVEFHLPEAAPQVVDKNSIQSVESESVKETKSSKKK